LIVTLVPEENSKQERLLSLMLSELIRIHNSKLHGKLKLIKLSLKTLLEIELQI
jgi:hypothetical protein